MMYKYLCIILVSVAYTYSSTKQISKCLILQYSVTFYRPICIGNHMDLSDLGIIARATRKVIARAITVNAICSCCECDYSQMA